jgi:hypothetical protein
MFWISWNEMCRKSQREKKNKYKYKICEVYLLFMGLHIVLHVSGAKAPRQYRDLFRYRIEPVSFCYSTPQSRRMKEAERCTGFEVLTAVVMKCCILWDTALCSQPKVNWRFGGVYDVHLQAQRICQTRDQHEVGTKQSLLHAKFLLRILLDPEDGGDIYQKTQLYIATVLQTSVLRLKLRGKCSQFWILWSMKFVWIRTFTSYYTQKKYGASIIKGN